MIDIIYSHVASLPYSPEYKHSMFCFIAKDVSPYSCYDNLAYQVKLALNSSRRCSPEVKIEVAMDLVIFRGRLAHVGTMLPACVRGQPIYGIQHYRDLDSFYGKGWHLRILNRGGDFCYCKKESMQFYLHKRKDITEVDGNGMVLRSVRGGYSVCF